MRREKVFPSRRIEWIAITLLFFFSILSAAPILAFEDGAGERRSRTNLSKPWPPSPGVEGLISETIAQGLHRIPLYIGEKEIWVEVAKTPKEQSKGLMGRKHLGQDEGMFFIFETEGYRGFWMKDTLIPLSLAFIDKEGRIIKITEMKPLTLEPHDPPAPILYALEMKRGWFSANGIKVGDVVRFSK
jgi:uncharacterized membrane protein (UPF0127 family)